MHKRVKNFKFIVANQDPTVEKALVAGEVRPWRGLCTWHTMQKASSTWEIC